MSDWTAADFEKCASWLPTLLQCMIGWCPMIGAASKLATLKLHRLAVASYIALTPAWDSIRATSGFRPNSGAIT